MTKFFRNGLTMLTLILALLVCNCEASLQDADAPSAGSDRESREIDSKTASSNVHTYTSPPEPIKTCPPKYVLNIDGSCTQPDISQKIFVYGLPDDETKEPKPPTPLPKPKIQYNVVVIKKDESDEDDEPIIVPPPQQKTVVLVLNKESDREKKVIEVKSPDSGPPEVYFVSYKEGENPMLPGNIDLKTALSAVNSGSSIKEEEYIETENEEPKIDQRYQLPVEKYNRQFRYSPQQEESPPIVKPLVNPLPLPRQRYSDIYCISCEDDQDPASSFLESENQEPLNSKLRESLRSELDFPVKKTTFEEEAIRSLYRAKTNIESINESGELTNNRKNEETFIPSSRIFPRGKDKPPVDAWRRVQTAEKDNAEGWIQVNRDDSSSQSQREFPKRRKLSPNVLKRINKALRKKKENSKQVLQTMKTSSKEFRKTDTNEEMLIPFTQKQEEFRDFNSNEFQMSSPFSKEWAEFPSKKVAKPIFWRRNEPIMDHKFFSETIMGTPEKRESTKDHWTLGINEDTFSVNDFVPTTPEPTTSRRKIDELDNFNKKGSVVRGKPVLVNYNRKFIPSDAHFFGKEGKRVIPKFLNNRRRKRKQHSKTQTSSQMDIEKLEKPESSPYNNRKRKIDPYIEWESTRIKGKEPKNSFFERAEYSDYFNLPEPHSYHR